ncbi:MAG TPA: DNA repair protein RecO, partial [Thermodesulfobacterium commune]|nr:DNA repair protein RecO [Thermodesulfobacterium commune]
MFFSVEGLVLSKEKIGEIDVLVEILTPKGKLWAIAKGAQKSRKRFVNLLEEFNLLNLHLRKTLKGALPILEKADLIFIPESIWGNLEKYIFFSYMGEVLSKVSFKGLEAEYFNFIKDWVKFL